MQAEAKRKKEEERKKERRRVSFDSSVIGAVSRFLRACARTLCTKRKPFAKEYTTTTTPWEDAKVCGTDRGGGGR